MKHKSSISQAYIRRDSIVLPELFTQAKATAAFPISLLELCKKMAEMPVDCFYISEDAAINYIRKRRYNKVIPHFVNKYKQRLFEALWRIVEEMMQSERYHNMELKYITTIALTRPAPCIGMTPEVIQQKIYAHIKKNRKAK